MSEILERELRGLGSAWRNAVPPGLRLRATVLAERAAEPLPDASSPEAARRRRSSFVAAAALVAVVALLVVMPGARMVVARQVNRVLQALRIAPHTELITYDVQTKQEVDESLRRIESQLTGGRVQTKQEVQDSLARAEKQVSNGRVQTKQAADNTLPRTESQPAGARMWHVYTVYGGFGGAVHEEAYFDPQQIDEPAVLLSRAPIALMAFDGEYRGEAVTFHHALLAPDGVVLTYFGAHHIELLLVQAPVGRGRSVAYSRVVSGPGGSVIGVAPSIETLTLNGQTVTWDPDTTGIMPNNSALRWEANGVSYSLYGRALTRDEAVALFSSLRPLQE